VADEEKKVLTFEEAEANTELKAEIELAKAEADELAHLQAEKLKIEKFIEDIETVRPDSWSKQAYNFADEVILFSRNEAAGVFGGSEKLYDRVWSIHKTFFINLGRLREAYRGDPREKKLEKVDKKITGELAILYAGLSDKNQIAFSVATIAGSLLQNLHFGVRELSRCIEVLKEIAGRVDNIIEIIMSIQQRIKNVIMPLEIKEEHILKTEEHPLFG
jgi:hypothetical protein